MNNRNLPPYQSAKCIANKSNYLYRLMFVVCLLLLLISQQTLAISPGITTQQASISDKLSSIGSEDQSELHMLVNGLRAFSREDFALANRLLGPLADKGVSEAQFYMGMMADAGLGTTKDVEKAYLWYQAAARGGHPSAQHNLAVAYAQGEGVSSDPDKAIFWWKKAADQGNADAQYNLGIVYAVGKLGVKQNMKVAKMWWQLAAQSGDGMAQYNLGILYANGKGTEKSYCEATRWWEKSIENGVSQAGVALEVLKQRKDYERCW